jgi:hypothetical protein
MGRFIIVGYDGTAANQAALAWALREGSLRHLPVRVVQAAPDAEQVPVLRIRLAEHLLAASAGGRANVSVTGVVRAGSPSSVLPSEATSGSMLVLDAGSLATLDRPPWTWAADIPVVLVRGTVRVPDRRPVVVVPDGVDSPAFALAAEEARRRDVALFAIAPDAPGATERPTQLVVVSPVWFPWATETARCPVLVVPESTGVDWLAESTRPGRATQRGGAIGPYRAPGADVQ